jgi:hypothetical protein
MTGLYRFWHGWLALNFKDRAIIILDILGIGVVVAYTTVAALQWCAMLHANKLTKQSVDAARESADAAVAASRAWIMPTGSLGKTWWAKSFLAVELDWTNVGKSPAVRIRATAEYRVDLMGGPFNAGCVTPKKTGWETSEAVLLPSGEFRLTLQSLPRNWNGKAKILSIHGCIWYADVLTNQERTTEFCEEVTNLRGIALVGICTGPYSGVPLLEFKPFIFG